MPTATKRTKVTNPSALAEILDILDDHATGVRRVFNVSIEGEVMRGNAEIPMSGQPSQFLAWKIDPKGAIGYRGVAAPRSDSWRADVGATKAGGRKMNCRSGNVQCGGKCQGASRNCFVGMSPQDKVKAQKAAKLARSPAKTTSIEQPKATIEKGGALALRGGALARVEPATQKTGSGAPGSGTKGKKKTTGKQSLTDKYGSDSPSDRDAAGFAKEYRKAETKKKNYSGRLNDLQHGEAFAVARDLAAKEGRTVASDILGEARKISNERDRQKFIENKANEIIKEHLKKQYKQGGGDPIDGAFKILGIPKFKGTPDRQALKDAYRSKARAAHPDNPAKTGSAEKFRRVNEAFERLKKEYKLDSLNRFDILSG